MRKIPWKFIVIIILTIVISIVIGIGIQSRCNIEVDNKIRYSEILNWISTIFIGFMVGFVFKNQFENNKVVKGYLLDDVKKISEELISLKNYCFSYKSNSCFTEEQRKEINSKMNLIDKKINVFSEFLKECYTDKHKDIKENLVNSFNSLNKKITGDEFYETSVSNKYFDDVVTESTKFESELRKLTLKIIKSL
jgi:hypothetical protein